KFTIEGARKRLKELNKRGGKGKEVESPVAQITLALPKTPESRDDSLLEIKKCLQELGKILESL
ncbi:MAG TPA: hypothetical protein VFW62_02415, partial [bacterium]|nr:hypothetical protein [bacterium]